MRAKDALQGEIQVLHRLSEKQTRAIEALNDAQRGLSSKLEAAEKEITLQQSAVFAHQRKIGELKQQKDDLAFRESGLQKQQTELTATLEERTNKLEAESSTSKRLQERVSKLERDLNAARTSAVGVGGGGANESDKALRKTNEHLNVSYLFFFFLDCICLLRFFLISSRHSSNVALAICVSRIRSLCDANTSCVENVSMRG
jgi:predicted  nucleic acid-binding Zn-ribbon protein